MNEPKTAALDGWVLTGSTLRRDGDSIELDGDEVCISLDTHGDVTFSDVARVVPVDGLTQLLATTTEGQEAMRQALRRAQEPQHGPYHINRIGHITCYCPECGRNRDAAVEEKVRMEGAWQRCLRRWATKHTELR